MTTNQPSSAVDELRASNFTKGPWGIYEDPDTNEIEIRPADACNNDTWTWEKIAGDVTKNNAPLIAAAPDLLKRLEDVKREAYRQAIKDAQVDGFLMPITGRVHATLLEMKKCQEETDRQR